MGRFNAEEFLKADYDEALDTERTLFPQGECIGESIEEMKILPPKMFEAEDGTQQEGSPQLELKIKIRDDHAQRIRDELGYAADRPVYFIFRTWLQISEQGWLDFGPNKNLSLGQIREALGQNIPGQKWNFSHLKGAGPIAFTVKHREWEKNGKKGTSEEVSRWASVD